MRGSWLHQRYRRERFVEDDARYFIGAPKTAVRTGYTTDDETEFGSTIVHVAEARSEPFWVSEGGDREAWFEF